MAFVHVQNLSFTFAGQTSAVLSDVNLEVRRGEFLLLCGPSGCGKTTLLRHIKPRLEPQGQKSGDVLFRGAPVSAMNDRDAASKVGMIMQNPENQIITETVRHELAFGLECLGNHPGVISKAVAETVSYFGIEDLYGKKTHELSGGEKQLVSIAAVMSMRPELIILDEPASQLDPVAARNLYDILQRLNKELGITVILSEHRIEDVFSVADRVAVMSGGRIIAAEVPGKAAAFMASSSDERIRAMLPVPARIFHAVNAFLNTSSTDNEAELSLPVTVREVKPWFEGNAAIDPLEKSAAFTKKENAKPTPLVNAESVFFRFGKNSEDVLNNLSLNVYEGELLSIVGGNGAGKTTLLRLLSGIIRPYNGRIAYANPDLRLVYLPQNPQSMFAFDTVIEDLLFVAGELGAGKRFLYSSGLSKVASENISPKLSAVIERLNIGNFLTRHPFDLSFGELQRAALAMILLKQPRVILLDEPTKGVDAHSKVGTAALLKSLCAEGVAVVSVTHDIEFAAEHSDRCAMLFDGRIIDAGTPARFFSGNICYTTVAHRIAGSVFPHAVTCEEVISQWKDHATKQ